MGVAGTDDIILIGPMLKKAPDLQDIGNLLQVAVDGGIRFAPKPGLWVGDGDSGTRPTDIPTIFKDNQDETDLSCALKALRQWKPSHLYLFGFLGGRWGHTLAGLGAVMTEMKSEGTLIKADFYDEDDTRVFFVGKQGTHRLSWDAPQPFSLIALEDAEITIEGACKYKADKLKVTALSGRTVSNEASGEIFVTATAPFVFCLEEK